MLAIAKEKEQQQLLLQMLVQEYRTSRSQLLAQGLGPQLADNTRSLQLILEAQQKLGANVSFQNVAEQLVLRILK